MIANTEAQGSLHPGIVGVDARRVIEFAAASGALGWKVNGAGGDGGSVTFLSATAEAKGDFLEHVASHGPAQALPCAPHPGQHGRASTSGAPLAHCPLDNTRIQHAQPPMTDGLFQRTTTLTSRR